MHGGGSGSSGQYLGTFATATDAALCYCKVVSARERLTTSLQEASLHDAAAAYNESSVEERLLAEGTQSEEARRQEEQRDGLPLVLSLAGRVERARTTRELALKMQAAQMQARRAADRATATDRLERPSLRAAAVASPPSTAGGGRIISPRDAATREATTRDAMARRHWERQRDAQRGSFAGRGRLDAQQHAAQYRRVSQLEQFVARKARSSRLVPSVACGYYGAAEPAPADAACDADADLGLRMAPPPRPWTAVVGARGLA